MLNTDSNSVKSGSGGDKDNLDLFRNRWRQHMEILNQAGKTIIEYVRLLDFFITFLVKTGITGIYDITKEHISLYRKEVFYHLNDKGRQNAFSTQNNYIRAMKTFFYFLQAEGYLSYNPAKGIAYAKVPTQLPKTILTPQEAKKLIKTPDIHTPLGYRDRAMLEVLYSTGIRRNELRNLKPQDVDCEKGFLRVTQGKGDRDRIVPLGKIACKYVENYIRLVRLDLVSKKNSPYLFLTWTGNQMCTGTMRDLIHKYTKKAKINKTVTPHVFRHSMATHLLQKKANIRCVQEILGHKFLDTTQKYTRITITDLKEAHQQCHPREREKMY